MATSVDRTRVEELLRDETLSYREIAHIAGCSDWSVRSISRALANDNRPMRAPSDDFKGDDGESIGLAGWGVVAGIAALFVGVVWLGSRNIRPP